VHVQLETEYGAAAMTFYKAGITSADKEKPSARTQRDLSYIQKRSLKPMHCKEEDC
jgi:hypothetical protein